LIVDLKAGCPDDAFDIIQNAPSALIARRDAALEDFHPPGEKLRKGLPKELDRLNGHAAPSVANNTDSTKLAKSSRISHHRDNVG
jgi:hypothetical protein